MAGFIQSLQSICLSLVLMRRLFTLFYRFGIDVWHYTSNGLVHTYEVEL